MELICFVIKCKNFYSSYKSGGFSGDSVVKNLPANAGDLGLILVGEMPWKRKWQSTPVFLPGKSHGQRSLEGYSPRGHKNSHTWLNNSVQFSCSVVSEFATPQIAGFPVHQTPGAYLNSYPLHWWCHPTISSSVIPVSSCLQSFPASGSFQWVSSLHQVAKVLELQLQHQSFQWIFRTDFLHNWMFDLLAVQGTLKSLLQHHSSKASVLQHSAFFIVQLSHPYMTTGNTIALTRGTFAGKVMSLFLVK